MMNNMMMASDEINKVYGALNGLEGMLKRKIICLSDQIKTASDFELLTHTPAMALGSCRFKLKKDNTGAYEEVLRILKDYNVGYFFYNGGNGSMDTVACLSEFFRSKGEDYEVGETVDGQDIYWVELLMVTKDNVKEIGVEKYADLVATA